jgi:DNA-binding response OmpR family regulator
MAGKGKVLSTRKRLLVVDDDDEMVYVLRDALETTGFDVMAFYDALPALRHVQEYGLPHLALIDLELPSMHGFELSDKLKALGDVPIVFLTGQDKVEMVVNGLTYYADDYVTKPFEMRELLARIQRVLSRFPGFEYTQSPIIEIDHRLAIDFSQSRLIIDGEEVLLTPTEAGILHILLRNMGNVVSSDTLIARIWPAEEVYEETLRVHIHRLRRKIEIDHRQPVYIQTERGIGYQFAVPGQVAPQDFFGERQKS